MNRSNPFSPNNPPAGGPGAPPPTGTPDTQWASVFQSASDAPPARVWSGIERQLNLDDEDGVLPLYPPQGLSRSALLGRGMAGVAAACLLTLFGWWTLRSNPVTPSVTSTVAMTRSARQPIQKSHLEASAAHPVAETDVPTRQRATVKTDYVHSQGRKRTRSDQPERAGNSVGDAAQLDESLAIELTPGTLVQPSATVEITVTESVAITTQARSAARSMVTNERMGSSFAPARSSFFAQSQPVHPGLMQTNGGAVVPSSTATVLPPSASTGNTSVAVALLVSNQVAASQSATLQEQLALSIQPMAIRPFTLKPAGNERIVWFSPEQSEATPAQKTARKARQKVWVSAGMVASSFNPSVALRAVSGLAYANNSATALVAGGPVPALALDSRAGRAIAVQANVGIPLSDRWTLETGVGYLTGQSTVQSPVRTTALLANKTNVGTANGATLYTDLIGGSTGNSAAYDVINQYANVAQRTALVANSSYDRTVSQLVSNNYQFVQVPVQVSYELRPRRKFGLALLTGMVSNLFVRNTVDALTVKAQDNVYKPLTLAGTAGMRLRFRSDRQWSASVAGIFQQSFQSITRADVGVQAVPQSMGVSFSVDRQF